MQETRGLIKLNKHLTDAQIRWAIRYLDPAVVCYGTGEDAGRVLEDRHTPGSSRRCTTVHRPLRSCALKRKLPQNCKSTAQGMTLEDLFHAGRSQSHKIS